MRFSLISSITLLALLDGIWARHVKHEFVIKSKYMAPDNFGYEGYTINDQFPGPLINVTRGDTVSIKVINQLKTNFSMHWHGILQKGTPFSDGVPMVTQSPIQPGDSYTYYFDVSEQRGTHWYHAHTRFDGELAFGGLIIQEKPNDWKQILKLEPRYKYDEERLLIISELWHKDPNKIYKGVINIPFDGPGFSDITLLNGHGYRDWNKDSNGTLDKNGKDNSTLAFNNGYGAINVDSNKIYRLRIIGALGGDKMNFTIDNHKFTVIEQDGTYLEPVEVDRVEIMGGQRISVLLKTDQPVGNYNMTAMRTVDIAEDSYNGYGFLHYNKAKPLGDSELKNERVVKFKLKPDRWIEDRMFTSNIYKNPEFKNKHYVPVPQHVDKHIYLLSMPNITHHAANLSMPEIFETINTFRPPKRERVVLHSLMDGTYKKDIEIFEVDEGDSVQIVMEHYLPSEFSDCLYHPWHLHGHAFHVVANGGARFNDTVDLPIIDQKVKSMTKLPLFVDTFTHYHLNVTNPSLISSTKALNDFIDNTKKSLQRNIRLDDDAGDGGYKMPPRDESGDKYCGWYAIRFVADNPGAWYMHCHITLHLAFGKSIIINVKPKDQAKFNTNAKIGQLKALEDKF